MFFAFSRYHRQSSISVEEDTVNVTLFVERSFPSFDTVTVAVTTINDSATANEDFQHM